MSRIIGIDLGTTFSCVACIDESSTPRTIPDSGGRCTVPSVVYVGAAEDEWEVGQGAKDRAVMEPERVVQFVKREMGLPADQVRRDGNGLAHPYTFWNRQLPPEELSSFILRHLRGRAQEHLRTDVQEAVVTVPAYFMDPERTATIRAAELAGLAVPRLINEPTAAALAFGLRSGKDAGRALVFDLGGGTFDVSLVEVRERIVEVVATAGDHRLGGKDWDDLLLKFAVERFGESTGLDLQEDPAAVADLRDRVERMKHRLSETDRTEVVIAGLGKRTKVVLTRAEFEGMSAHLVSRCMHLVEGVMEEKRMSMAELQHVVLAGGATRMPMIRAALEEAMGRALPTGSVNPDECVALGAAIVAGKEEQRGARRGSTLRLYADARERLQALTLSDVTSQNLGFVTVDGNSLKTTFVIRKNTPVPCSVTREDLTTVYEGQDRLEIHVVEGDFADPRLCTQTESFICTGIPKRARPPRLAVTFEYDVSGVIRVCARESTTGTDLWVARTERTDLDALLSGRPVPTEVVLTLDTSGSMAGEPLQEVKVAAHRFLDAVNLDGNSVALVSFGDVARTVVGLTGGRAVLGGAINGLCAGGGTDMEAGLEHARNLLREGKEGRCIVLMSDGQPNCARSARSAAEKAKGDGCILVTVATGSANRAYMRELASSARHAYDVTNAVSIEQTFVNLAKEIASGAMLRGGS